MLKQRIEILKTSGVIDEDVALFVNGIIDEFSSKNFNEGNFEQSKKMFEYLKLKSPVPIPNSEKKFILMHICNLLQG